MRGFVLGLCLLSVVGCAGNGGSSEPALDALLPRTLAGVELEKESFTGPEWLKARPESSSPYFLPEFRADPRRLLRRLGKRPQDLTVEWALAPEGIQVIAYRVRDATAAALVLAYVDAIGGNVRTRRIDVAGRTVTMIRARLPQRGFLYAHGNVLYAANSFHVDGGELEELISKLPGGNPPRPSLIRRLPVSLAGTRLTRETFEGDIWVAAAPEEAFQPEVQVDLRRFLAAMGVQASALTVAWGIAPDGPKVVAYQAVGVEGNRVLSSFLRSLEAIHTTQRRISGKPVTIVATNVPGRLGYLYVHEDTLFAGGSNHLDRDEVNELLSKLR